MQNIDLRYPNISGANADAKISQLQSYIYQLVGQLNYALNDVETLEKNGKDTTLISGTGSTNDEATKNFNEIKALIIKSADIVNAYYTQLKRRFDGVYVAESDFGVYKDETSQTIEENSTAITRLFSETERIKDTVSSISSSDAWIRSGKLEEGSGGIEAVYGVEVGEIRTVEGKEVFNKYARFTSDGIYFYTPQSSEPIAYMTGTTLNITNINVPGKTVIGGYTIDTSDGIAFKWSGGA